MVKYWAMTSFCISGSLCVVRSSSLHTVFKSLLFRSVIVGCVGVWTDGRMMQPAACMYREAFPNTRDPLPAMMEHVVGAIRAKNPGVQPQLVLVVIPEKEVEPYKAIKFQSDVRHGVPSQCLVAANAAIGAHPSMPCVSPLQWGEMGLLNHVRGCDIADIAHGAHRRV